MGIYEEFAYFYTKGAYTSYAERMLEILPSLLRRYGAEPHTILDLACGEGTFAVAMAKQGSQVTGVDQSRQMLHFAKEKARQAGVEVDFLRGDVRSLSLRKGFDLVTCWYDSLNYLLELQDLEKAFAEAHRVLNSGGLFVFDMNTVHGLAADWQRQACYVQQDTPELLEIHRSAYDFETNTATLQITGFVRKGALWHRMDEEHRERGYPIDQIRRSLQTVGLQEVACLGSLREMSEPKPDDGRVWFVAAKSR